MKYHQLEVSKARSGKRLGRGIAAGQGKTAGRGTKGQNSRTGSSRRPGFEGGQNPLTQRLPKLPGFRSFKPRAEIIYIKQLDQFGTGKVIDSTALSERGLISSPFANVKLISQGQITKKVSVKLQSASQSAITAIEKLGGKFEASPQLGRPKKTKS